MNEARPLKEVLRVPDDEIGVRVRIRERRRFEADAKPALKPR